MPEEECEVDSEADDDEARAQQEPPVAELAFVSRTPP